MSRGQMLETALSSYALIHSIVAALMFPPYLSLAPLSLSHTHTLPTFPVVYFSLHFDFENWGE